MYKTTTRRLPYINSMIKKDRQRSPSVVPNIRSDLALLKDCNVEPESLDLEREFLFIILGTS